MNCLLRVSQKDHFFWKQISRDGVKFEVIPIKLIDEIKRNLAKICIVQKLKLRNYWYFWNKSTCFEVLTKVLLENHLYRITIVKKYTNAELKIFLYARLHIKVIPWKFWILKPKNSRVIYAWSLYFSLKIGYFLRYSFVSVCL